MALLTSLTALSIDAMLPALTDIGAELGVSSANGSQLIITTLFAGFAVGQLFYGPVSDSAGRKRPIYAGLIIFAVGSVLAMAATSFTVMLVGRVLQGFGAAAPRIVVIALVRDQYDGRAMARIMSFVLGVFVLVPMLAPAIGQAILLVGSWRMIFAMLLALAIIVSVWFAIRQPETLAPTDRVDFSVRRIAGAVLEVCRDRSALGYTIASGIVFGAFLGYLNSAQQIFQLQYALGAQFPLYFAALALSIGCASFANSMLVMRYGMRRLSWLALAGSFVASGFYLVYAINADGMPPLWTLMSWGLFTFFCFGLVFGNFNAMAIESLGHIAGVAAAVIGSLGTMISLLLGLLIGQAYDGTVLPLVGGFALLSLSSLIAMRITEKGLSAS
jgi:DHA1 family bicyclomycin/chloramphenicol resistance-like MFS transporter